MQNFANILYRILQTFSQNFAFFREIEFYERVEKMQNFLQKSDNFAHNKMRNFGKKYEIFAKRFPDFAGNSTYNETKDASQKDLRT